jgi:predicted phage tail protein
MNRSIRRSIATLLVVSMTGLALPVPSLANADVRSEARSQLIARGVNVAEANARVDALTDHEAAELVANIDGLPAGAGAGNGGLVAVVAIGAAIAFVLIAIPYVAVGAAALTAIALARKGGGNNTPVQADPLQGPAL